MLLVGECGGATDAMLVDYLLCVKRAGGRELEVELELLKAALEIAKARSNTEVEVGTLKAGTWRVGRHLEVEVATLKGQLDTTTLQLKFTTTDYLRVQVLLDMRGVMEYHRTKYLTTKRENNWDTRKASACWAKYIAHEEELKGCLEKHNLDVERAGDLLAKMYELSPRRSTARPRHSS